MSCRYFIWISRLVLWQRSSILKCTQIIGVKIALNLEPRATLTKLYIFSAFKHKPFRCISCFCVVIHFWSFSQRMSVYLSIIFFKKKCCSPTVHGKFLDYMYHWTRHCNFQFTVRRRCYTCMPGHYLVYSSCTLYLSESTNCPSHL